MNQYQRPSTTILFDCYQPGFSLRRFEIPKYLPISCRIARPVFFQSHAVQPRNRQSHGAAPLHRLFEMRLQHVFHCQPVVRRQSAGPFMLRPTRADRRQVLAEATGPGRAPLRGLAHDPAVGVRAPAVSDRVPIGRRLPPPAAAGPFPSEGRSGPPAPSNDGSGRSADEPGPREHSRTGHRWTASSTRSSSTKTGRRESVLHSP